MTRTHPRARCSRRTSPVLVLAIILARPLLVAEQPPTGLELAPSGVVLRGEKNAAGCVTLDGGDRGRILSAIGSQEGTEIRGITFRNGKGVGTVPLDELPLDARLEYEEGRAGTGGAIYCEDSRVRVTNCRFLDNRAGSGAAVRIVANTLAYPSFVNCEFRGNDAEDGRVITSFGLREPEFIDCQLDMSRYKHELSVDFEYVR